MALNLKLISISACLSQIFSPCLESCTSYHSRTMQQLCLSRENWNASVHVHWSHLLGYKRFWLLLQIGLNFPLLWGKRKEQWFTDRYLHETGIRGGWGPRTCCFVGSCNTASMPLLRRGPTTTPFVLFFSYAKEAHLNWEFLQEVLSKSGDAQRRHLLFKG